MASATFVLKEPTAQIETLIFLIIREGGKRLKYSTGEKIHPDKWDSSTQRVQTQAILSPSERVINIQLNRYLAAFEVLNLAAKAEGIPLDLSKARIYLDSKFKTKAKPQAAKQNFIQFADAYILATDKSTQTKKGYRTTVNTLKAFEAAKKRTLHFEDITLDFYDSFIDFCNSKDFAINTTGSHLKNIKVFSDVAFEKELHQNTAYKNKRFKVLDEESVSIYLTEVEVAKLFELELPLNSRLDKVRDLFIVGCRTGLRFSDLRNLTPDKIISTEGGQLIRIRSQKTKGTVYIPLHWQTLDILKKHNFDLPRVLSNQKFNEYLKELAAKAEFNNAVTISRTKGGQRCEEILPKHKLVTVHTARRTFATLAYKAGVPANSIMKITGHNTEKSFQKYIKLTNEEHAQLMAKHDFFKPQPLKIVS